MSDVVKKNVPAKAVSLPSSSGGGARLVRREVAAAFVEGRSLDGIWRKSGLDARAFADVASSAKIFSIDAGDGRRIFANPDAVRGFLSSLATSLVPDWSRKDAERAERRRWREDGERLSGREADLVHVLRTLESVESMPVGSDAGWRDGVIIGKRRVVVECHDLGDLLDWFPGGVRPESKLLRAADGLIGMVCGRIDPDSETPEIVWKDGRRVAEVFLPDVRAVPFLPEGLRDMVAERHRLGWEEAFVKFLGEAVNDARGNVLHRWRDWETSRDLLPVLEKWDVELWRIREGRKSGSVTDVAESVREDVADLWNGDALLHKYDAIYDRVVGKFERRMTTRFRVVSEMRGQGVGISVFVNVEPGFGGEGVLVADTFIGADDVESCRELDMVPEIGSDSCGTPGISM